MEPIRRSFSLMTSLQDKFGSRSSQRNDVELTSSSKAPISVEASFITTMTKVSEGLMIRRRCHSKLRQLSRSRRSPTVHVSQSERSATGSAAPSVITSEMFAINESPSKAKLKVKVNQMTTAFWLVKTSSCAQLFYNVPKVWSVLYVLIFIEYSFRSVEYIRYFAELCS